MQEARCHCRNLVVQLKLSRPLAELRLRRCGCDFCRKHGAVSITDPNGSAIFRAPSPAAIVRYRFGLATADYLLCTYCGIYVGAMIDDGKKSYATVNANTFAPTRDESIVPALVSYDGENAEARIRRRLTRWTPAELITH